MGKIVFYIGNLLLWMALLCAFWIAVSLIVLAFCFPEEAVFVAIGCFLLWEMDVTRRAAIAAASSTSHLLDFPATRFLAGTGSKPERRF